jgi:hypothetical protein
MMVLGSFANSVSVAQLGDVYRGYLLNHEAEVSLPMTLGTILAERLVDLVTLLGLLAAAALTVYSGRLPRQATDALIAGVVVSVAGMLGLLLLPRSRRLVERLVPARWRQTYDRFEHGALRSLGRVPLLIACSALGWLIEGATLFLLTAHGGGTEHRHALHASARVAAFSHAAVPLGQRGAARALDCCFTSS